MLLLSFLITLLGSAGLLFTWRFGKRGYSKLRKAEGCIEQLQYPEYAEKLLTKYNINFKLSLGTGNGVCNYRKKEIQLTYNPGAKIFDAFWEAAHEVGHAVHGQPIFFRPVQLILLFATLFASTVWGGIHGHASVLVIDCVMVSILFFVKWLDEVGASRFAEKELSRVIDSSLPARRLAFDKVYLALEDISLVVAVSGSFTLLYFSIRGVFL